MKFYPIEKTIDGGPTLSGWCTRQGHQSVLFFAHGNGFCGRVYEPMHELLARQYDLLMFDLPGHGCSAPHHFDGWNHTAEHLRQALSLCDEFIAGREVHAVGHSLGGMLSMLAASSHPGTFSSMVMLDPIMFPQPLLFFMHLLNKVGLTSVFHPFVKPTLRRRREWSSREQAFDYFHNRKIFKGWQDRSLQCYVDHALIKRRHEDEGSLSGVELRCDPAREARWFASLPEKLWPAVAKLDCPVSIFMGQETYPFALRAGAHAQKKNTNITFSVVPGGHCFMQEFPQQAAERVLSTLTDSAK